MWRICIPNTSKKRLVVWGPAMYVGWSFRAALKISHQCSRWSHLGAASASPAPPDLRLLRTDAASCGAMRAPCNPSQAAAQHLALLPRSRSPAERPIVADGHNRAPGRAGWRVGHSSALSPLGFQNGAQRQHAGPASRAEANCCVQVPCRRVVLSTRLTSFLRREIGRPGPSRSLPLTAYLLFFTRCHAAPAIV